MKKKLGLAIMMVGMGILAATILTGCNTAKGFGRDMKSGGNAIENASGK